MRMIRCFAMLASVLTAVSASAGVTVVSTYPANGATDVDPGTESIRVRFSEAVGPHGYSFVNTDDGAAVPFAGKPVFSEGNRLCTIAVKLEPGTAYAVSINSSGFTGFRSEAGGTPVTPYLLKFATSGKAVARAAMSAEKWKEDLAHLASELPKKHKNLFAKVTESDWNARTRSLNDRIPSLSEAEIRIGLMALVASVGDQHTSIHATNSELSVLPIGLYWFKDGVFVTAASDAYKTALGCRVTKVGDLDIDKACEAVSTLFAHDNESARRQGAPTFLVAPDFLKWAGVVAETDEVDLSLQDKDGKTFKLKVASVRNGSSHDLKSVLDDAGAAVPLCRMRSGQPYWADYVARDNLVYFQYNQCKDASGNPFAEMRTRVEKLLAEHKDARLVIDLRNNGGGDSSVLDPFIEALKSNADVNRRGRLFVVTGRRTFSSAILNAASLRNETEAVLVGEPTGASPNHYGEVRAFELPNSGLTVSYSTKYFEYSDKDVDAITPDMAAEPTFAEFLRGEDPAMEAILSYSKQ